MEVAFTRSVLCLVVLAGTGAAAQEESPAPLTLEAAIDRALRKNETPAIARARQERASALTREAWARLLPAASVQATYTRRSREVQREVGGETVVIQSFNALRGQATVAMSLLDAPAIPLILRAGRLEAATAHEAESMVQALAFNVASAFYAVLSAERVLTAAQRRVVVSEEGLRVAERRLQAGLVGKQEVTRTQLALSTARLELTDATLQRATSRLVLGELIAAPADMPLAPPELAPDPPLGTVSDRPDVKRLEESLRAAELSSLEPWLTLVPAIGVGATYTYNSETGLSGVPTDWNLQATMAWTLYDGGVRYAQARARAAEAAELRHQLSALRRAAEREHQEALLRLEAALSAVEEANTTTRIARENASEVERLFEAGLATALERDDATVSAYEAEAELAQKTFAARLARLQQRYAHGLWPLTDAQPGQERDR